LALAELRVAGLAEGHRAALLMTFETTQRIFEQHEQRLRDEAAAESFNPREVTGDNESCLA
jgi:hypothetical protein